MSAQSDTAFLKPFAIVLAGLVLFTFSIFLLAQRFSASDTGYEDPLAQAQQLQRLSPVGQSRIAE